MQLVGDRFTAPPRTSATTLDPAGLPGRDPRSGRHPRRVSAFQIHFASRDILTRRSPEHAGAMNPRR